MMKIKRKILKCREAEELERQKLIEEELAKEKEAKREKRETIRKRKQAESVPEKTDEELAGYSKLKFREVSDADAMRVVKTEKTQISGGLWTDEDLNELIRLVKKYPGGSSNRWEIIAEKMNRTVTEVTFMAAKLKETAYKLPGSNDSVAENLVQQNTELKSKVKTKKSLNSILVTESNWSQEQQRALEAAIVKHRKTAGGDRWQKIANSVPDKTKEECLARYKYLVELLKTQKENQVENEAVIAEVDTASPTENMHNIDGSQKEDVQDEAEQEHKPREEAEQEHKPKAGKPRNLRKERKKLQEFSSDSDD